MTYDLYSDIATYSITFPSRGSYVFQDSTLSVYDSLGVLVKSNVVGIINEHSVYKKILMDELNDFGLESAGFHISDISKVEDAIIYTWSPPLLMSFISKVLSKESKGLLTGLIFMDEKGEPFNKTFYEDYISINNLDVPTRVKSHFITSETEVFKEVKFRNIEIN